MKDQIRKVIRDYWNDSMRKDWRMALADPVVRNKRLDELAEEIVRHLTNQSSGRELSHGICFKEEIGVKYFPLTI